MEDQISKIAKSFLGLDLNTDERNAELTIQQIEEALEAAFIAGQVYD